MKATPAEVVNTLTALIVQSAVKNKKLHSVNDMFYMVWKINVLVQDKWTICWNGLLALERRGFFSAFP